MVSITEVPTSVKVLRYLVDKQDKGATSKEVIFTLGVEKRRVNKALKKLAEKGLIKVESELFYYVESPNTNDLSQKLFKLYETVKKPPKDQIIKDLVLKLYLKPEELEIKLLGEDICPEKVRKIMEYEVGRIIASKTTCMEVRLKQ